MLYAPQDAAIQPPAPILPPYVAPPSTEEIQKELESMRAAMEVMRLEKMRLEAETMRRAQAEEEEKKRKEAAEKALVEKEEARALAELYKPMQIWMADAISNPNHPCQCCRELFRTFEKRGENLIQMCYHNFPNVVEMILSDRALYYITYGICGHSIKISTIYAFDQPLSYRQSKMLKNYVSPICTSLCTKILSTQLYDTNLRRKFESVIRIIPGSYKNGDWKQLDGFFGMYYNEKTDELSEFPPCDM